MEVKESQMKLLELAKIFAEVCEENNINYTLAYGSILGAVRHNGFIPWDKDMDVFVPINQYNLMREKLLERIKNDDKYVLHIWDSEPKYYEALDRFSFKGVPHQSLHFDIFPVMGVPSNSFLRCLYVNFSFLTYKFLRCKNCDTNYSMKKNVAIINFLKIFARIFPDKMIINWYTYLQNKYKLENSEYCYCLAGGIGSKEIMKKNWIFDTEKVKFEDTELYIPKEYKNYLIKVYGPDYMTPKRRI